MLITRTLLATCSLLCAACSVYDSNLAYANPIADSGSARDACVAHTEVCNGTDDDCDGQVDEEAAVTADCAARVLNAEAACESGFCIRVGPCHEGFFNCDGRPDNGCEAACPCLAGCDGQGDEDAGADAG